MNAVGIDVSKGKSMVAIMRPFGEIVSAPFQSQYHQLCWWFVFALPGRIAFPPEGGLTNHSFSYWWPLKSGSFLLF